VPANCVLVSAVERRVLYEAAVGILPRIVPLGGVIVNLLSKAGEVDNMRRSCSRRLQFLVARSALTWFIEQHLRLSASDFVHATLTSEEFAIWFAMLQLATLTSTEVVTVTGGLGANAWAVVTAPTVLAIGLAVTLWEAAVVPAPAVLVIGLAVTFCEEAVVPAPAVLAIGLAVTFCGEAVVPAPAVLAVGLAVTFCEEAVVPAPAVLAIGLPVTFCEEAVMPALAVLAIALAVTLCEEAVAPVPAVLVIGLAVTLCEEVVVPAPTMLVIGFVVTLFVEVAQKLRPTLEGTVHAPQVSWQIV